MASSILPLAFQHRNKPLSPSSTLLRCATVASELHLTAASALPITCFSESGMSTSDAVMLSVLYVLCIQTYKPLLTSNDIARRICTAMYFYACCISLMFCRLSRFDASSPTASSVLSIVRAANSQLVGRPVGNSKSWTIWHYDFTELIYYSRRFPEQYCATLTASIFLFFTANLLYSPPHRLVLSHLQLLPAKSSLLTTHEALA